MKTPSRLRNEGENWEEVIFSFIAAKGIGFRRLMLIEAVFIVAYKI